MTSWRLAIAVVATAIAGGCSRDAGSVDPGGAAPGSPINATLEVPADPKAPLRITLEADFGDAWDRRVAFARGVVGAYAPFDFSAALGDVHALDPEGRPIPMEREKDGGLRLRGRRRLAKISYEIDGKRSEETQPDTLTSIHRRANYTFISGYATWLLVDGSRDRPVRVRLKLPDGWRVGWSLPREDDGTYLAPSFFELLDEPAMLGTEFRTEETPGRRGDAVAHVFAEASNEEAPRHLAVVIDAIRRAEGVLAALELPPLDRPYHVFFELFRREPGRKTGWALEHGYSFHGAEELGADWILDPSGQPSARFVYHVAHHMMHAWLPRRIYTESLHPHRQLEAAPTSGIWFAEGFAQYMTFVGMARSGAAPIEQVLSGMARRFGEPMERASSAAPLSMSRLSLLLSTGDHTRWAEGFACGALMALRIDEYLHLNGATAFVSDALPKLLAWCREHPAGIPDDQLLSVLSKTLGTDIAAGLVPELSGEVNFPVAEILAAAGVAQVEGRFRVIPDAEASPAVRSFRAAVFGRR